MFSERDLKNCEGTETPVGCGICKTCIEQRVETPIISLESIMEGFE